MSRPTPSPRLPAILAALLLSGVLLAPASALARAGGGASMGSRGSRTFSAPAPTRSAPGAAEPIGRSFAPRTEPEAAPLGSPAYAPSPYAARPAMGGYGAPLSGRSAFTSGLMGGLIGAGIGGMLMGHGMFGGLDGAGSLFGLLIQVGLVVLLGRWLFRRFGGQMPAMAVGGLGRARFGGGLGQAASGAAATRGGPGTIGGRAAAARPGAPVVAIGPADYQAFEQLLRQVQQAWSTQDLAALRGLTTPEMVGYFSEQLSDQASRGQRNSVADVRLEAGDLSEAWAEGSREYATVAMRYSMLDVTRDARGTVVDGSLSERVSVLELWTFLRARGGHWVLGAIQQGR